MESTMSEATGQKHTEEYRWTYARTNSKGEKIYRHDTNQTVEFVMDYLDSKGIEYELKQGGSMLWVYNNDKAYSYYYTTGRWSPYKRGSLPNMHFSSKGIMDFVERFLTKYDKKEEPEQKRINPRTGKPYYYKDNPDKCKARAARNRLTNMYVDGKYVSKSHPLYKAGKYSGFSDVAFSSLEGYGKSKAGYIYIMHSASFPGWIKVGMAMDAEDRIKQFQTGSPYRDYELIKSYKVEDRREAEAMAHKELSAKGVGRKGEWFYMSHPVATDKLDKIFPEAHQFELF